MNKETVKEGALRIIPDKSSFGATERSGFIKGAKWQQERYSKMGIIDITCDTIDYEIKKYAIEQFKKK